VPPEKKNFLNGLEKKPPRLFADSSSEKDARVLYLQLSRKKFLPVGRR
jgi:hypothetical protein